VNILVFTSPLDFFNKDLWSFETKFLLFSLRFPAKFERERNTTDKNARRKLKKELKNPATGPALLYHLLNKSPKMAWSVGLYSKFCIQGKLPKTLKSDV